MTTPSKQELGHTQTPEAGELTEILRDIRDDLSGIASGFYSEDQTELSTAMAAKAGEIIDYIDAAAEKIYSAYSTLLSRVSQLESDCRMKDEALRKSDETLRNLHEVAAEQTPGAPDYERSDAAKIIQAALSPAPQPDAVQADETAWLIEFSEKVSRTPAYYGHTGEGLGETTDSLKAVRFARREDAQAIIDDIGWNEARPVEHMWTDSKCCNGLSPEECAQVPGRHCDGLQAALSPAPQPDAVQADELVKHMVDRFLGWKLPRDTFNPDCGISFDKELFNTHTPYPMKHEPSGTNLFDADQATAMVRYMLDGFSGLSRKPLKPDIKPEWCIEAARREGDAEVGAGFHSLPEAAEALASPPPADDVVERIAKHLCAKEARKKFPGDLENVLRWERDCWQWFMPEASALARDCNLLPASALDDKGTRS